MSRQITCEWEKQRDWKPFICKMETSTHQLLPLRASTERGFSMSCLRWLFAGSNHPKRRARCDAPALPMSNVPAPSDTVMLASALAGRTVTPRSNRNKSGDVEQKADFLIRGLLAEILCPCLVWGTARSGTPGRTRIKFGMCLWVER